MDILLLVAKYTFFGIFIFLGATVFTKFIAKFIEKKTKKDKNDDKR
jgi:hypothetical protein